MDLLFKRYASPFPFIDGMIQAGGFCEFVSSVWNTDRAEKDEATAWDYYIHRVFEGSFENFKESLKRETEHKNLSDRTIETTLNHTMNILNNFNPEKGGGE